MSERLYLSILKDEPEVLTVIEVAKILRIGKNKAYDLVNGGRLSSMKEIQEWLGHSNISTTANIYAHVDSESKRESARIIDKVLSTEEVV